MSKKPVNLRGAAILVVDDTDANRAVLCQLLDSQGYTVAAAPSGEIALKLVQSDPPELILPRNTRTTRKKRATQNAWFVTTVIGFQVLLYAFRVFRVFRGQIFVGLNCLA